MYQTIQKILNCKNKTNKGIDIYLSMCDNDVGNVNKNNCLF